MEAIKQKIKNFQEINRLGEHHVTQEYLAYQNFLNSGVDIVKDRFQCKFVPLSFFLLLFNTKNNRSFEENNEIGLQLGKTVFFFKV